MNGELLSVLDHIEREKGIKREVLIQAVEAALISAARKVVGKKTTDDITVKINPKTGEIKILSGETEVASQEFSRIAAQTAKQVIIQKIREAERDVVFNDFQNRVGSIVSGSVHRLENGNVIVDLGKTEALLPRRELPPNDEYRQGDRIRAYVLEVKKTARGPQIILSRTHADLVRRLFELEVPEIDEGILEIKSISREPGERTKIAVYSKDERVDCVGACVGMRGSRVKEIIKELHGEKIDIVRYSDDVREYIGASLSPAKVHDMEIDKEHGKALVIVEDDQLSLSIGKKGQNVRLAAKLTGWDIDIKSKSELAKEKDVGVEELSGVGPKMKAALTEAGFATVSSIASATPETLMKVKGVGEKTAQKLLNNAKKMVEKLRWVPKAATPPRDILSERMKEVAAEEEAQSKAGKEKTEGTETS
ncbi:MAG: transcription termination/antitermination protein NusA [Candidatus Omnitrophica bacterium]|nr:transcription termination/antitermination protein NusA [Candidatus Omnitrophota bacterium]